jgi:hypothetical protein
MAQEARETEAAARSDASPDADSVFAKLKDIKIEE